MCDTLYEFFFFVAFGLHVDPLVLDNFHNSAHKTETIGQTFYVQINIFPWKGSTKVSIMQFLHVFIGPLICVLVTEVQLNRQNDENRN